MSLQMTGDISCAEHLPTDATSDLAFMPDHMGAESVFGGESRGTGLRLHNTNSFRSVESSNNTDDVKGLETDGKDSHRYLTLEWSF